MMYMLRTPIDSEYEDIDMLLHYEWVAHVITKAFAKIVWKIENEIALTPADKMRNYEISTMIFTLVKQVNYYNFSEYDLVQIYREKELAIADEMKRTTKFGRGDTIGAEQVKRKGLGAYANTVDLKT